MAADYYKTLGVSRNATTGEIKKAFRTVARDTHPDANPNDPGAEARFRAAAEAYEVLSDPDRRSRYDRGDTIDLSSLFGSGGLEDLINTVFGDGGLFANTPRRQQRGSDILVRVEIGLYEAAFGTDVPVRFDTRSTCAICSGTGAAAESGSRTCPDCGGAGSVRVARRSLFGTMMSLSTCPTCRGEGIIISDPCRACGGSGAMDDVSEVKVEIPAGITSRTRLRLSGRGESGGRSGPPGDLFVEVEVGADERFERVEDDLVARVSIGIAEATLGTLLDVPLIEGGSAELEVPPGTQPGAVFTIGSAGMTRLGRRSRGDLHIVVVVSIPDVVTPEEEDLLRRWADLRGERVDRNAPTG